MPFAGALPHLEVDHRTTSAPPGAAHPPGVKKVFIRSGIRFDYLMLDHDTRFFRELVQHHVSGQLKVAPEHVPTPCCAHGKPGNAAYRPSPRRFAEFNRKAGLKQYLVPYYISAHPGAGLREAVELAESLRDSGFAPDQAQDFYPTPGTLSTAMYSDQMGPETGAAVHVARGERERAMQRALLQYKKPENRELVREALILAGRRDLIGDGPKCLIRKQIGGGCDDEGRIEREGHLDHRRLVRDWSAIALEAAGYRAGLILSGRRKDALDRVALECASRGAEATAVLPFDLEDPVARAAACAKAPSLLGSIDVLVLNAGMSQRSTFLETAPEVFDRVMALDFSAQADMVRRCLPAMVARRSGCLVAISSFIGLAGMPMRPAYSSASTPWRGCSRTFARSSSVRACAW